MSFPLVNLVLSLSVVSPGKGIVVGVDQAAVDYIEIVHKTKQFVPKVFPCGSPGSLIRHS